MATPFQMLTMEELLGADDDLEELKQLLANVATKCNGMISGCDDEDMRRECNMILQINRSTSDRVNSILVMVRE